MIQRISAVFFILLIAGCNRQTKSDSIPALSILSAENLSGDDSLNWIGEALPALVTLQLEGLPDISVRRASHDREAAPGSLRVYCRYQQSQQQLQVDCWQQGTESTIHVSGSLEKGLAAIADEIAKDLYSKPHPAISVSNEALKAYAEGRYEDSVQLAPDFGLAYVEGAIKAASVGNREHSLKLVDAGIARGKSIPELYLSQLEFTKASLTGDREGQLSSLGKITKLDPSDSIRLRNYAQLLLSARRLPEAASAQAALTQLRPDDLDAWNMLGYFRAYAGDLDGAKQALEKYAALSSQSPNAIDSLGEVHFYLGKFKEAEQYFVQSFEKDPKFNRGDAMFKAAISRFRAGDTSGAKELFNRYTAELNTDQEWLNIRWEYMTGNRENAEREARTFAAKGTGNVVAWSHAALWALVRGDSSAASSANQELIRAARVSQPRGDAVIVGLISRLVEGAKVEVPPPALRPAFDLGTGFSLILKKQSADAESLLKQLYEQSSPQNDRISRLLLAWAAADHGNAALRQDLLKVNTVPSSAADQATESVLFVKELELRR